MLCILWRCQVVSAPLGYFVASLRPSASLRVLNYLPNFSMIDIFVFGSNLRGIHGAGAAKFAREHHGAILGRGTGLQGTSYAIPTKYDPYKVMPLVEINEYVKVFLEFAKKNPEYNFNVTAIGCGLAGYDPKQIAPMFKDHSENVHLDERFENVLRA